MWGAHNRTGKVIENKFILRGRISSLPKELRDAVELNDDSIYVREGWDYRCLRTTVLNEGVKRVYLLFSRTEKLLLSVYKSQSGKIDLDVKNLRRWSERELAELADVFQLDKRSDFCYTLIVNRKA